MSFNNQGAHISSGLDIPAAAEAYGFVYKAITGTWTSTALGSNFLMTGTGGNAVVELMSDFLYSGNTPTAAAQKNFTNAPFYGYVYVAGGTAGGMFIAKVIQVMDANHFIVNVSTSASSATLKAVTRFIKAPSEITFSIDTQNDFMQCSFPDGTTYTSPGGGGVVEKVISAGEGTLEPFLSASNGGGSNTVGAVIQY